MTNRKWRTLYGDYEVSFELLTSRDGSRRTYKVEIKAPGGPVPHALYVGTLDDLEGAITDFIDGLAIDEELFRAETTL